jgi:DNA gyrase/topoisomerase IV subunit B
MDQFIEEILSEIPENYKMAENTASSNDFKIMDIKEHIRKKSMWAGSNEKVSMGLLGLDDKNKLCEIKNHHTPSLIKSFDELIVNASDASSNKKNKVTYIEVTFHKTNGFMICNNGKGIIIKKIDKTIYNVEAMFSIPFSTTNSDKKQSDAAIKGGTNGLGAKIANCKAETFQVEVCDGKYSYSQLWKNCLSERYNPVIVDSSESYVKVIMKPKYVEIGYTQRLSDADFNDITMWLRLRLHYIATYLGEDVSVSFNGVRCLTTDLSKLSITLLGEDIQTVMHTTMKSKAEAFKKFNWDIAISLFPKGKKIINNLAIVNGVISNKGSHIQHVKKIITAHIDSKLEKVLGKKGKNDKKTISTKEILSSICIFMKCIIPGVDWNSQTKDEVQISSDIVNQYSINMTFLNQLSNIVSEKLLMSQSSKQTKSIVNNKHRKSVLCNTNEKKNTYLVVAEGDSAITLIIAGASNSRLKNGRSLLDYIGIISIQGVILNAAREIKECETQDGETFLVRNAKLQNNKRLLELAEAFGLRYDCKYETKQEIDTLHYGKMLLCVDQDLDGIGKIAPLVLVWLNLFWPALLKNGIICRLRTPIIRLYSKKKSEEPLEFYSEHEMIKIIDSLNMSNYRVQYYKGLATHDDKEARKMFEEKKFKSEIFTYNLDGSNKYISSVFNIYFGADPSLRKKELIIPVKQLTDEDRTECENEKKIFMVKEALNIDTKSFKLDDLKRKIPSVIDGLNISRRKILAGAIHMFANRSDPVKVFQLGGHTAEYCNYHHGDASLNSSIITMAQTYNWKIPFLIGVGQFGSRHGHEAGSPRYIGVIPSKIAYKLIKKEDEYFLDYYNDDGKTSTEPTFYIPILPPVLNDYKSVSEGWNHVSYSRDIKSVLDIVNAYIEGDTKLISIADRLITEGHTEEICSVIDNLSKIWNLPPNTSSFKGRIVEYKNTIYSVGVYKMEKNKIIIEELPIGVQTLKYIENLTKKMEVKDSNYCNWISSVNDKSDTTNVKVEIVLYSSHKIKENYGNETFDSVEEFLLLRSAMHSFLNYYGTNNSILEFKHYLSVILYWAPHRRNLYETRINRSKILKTYQITELKEIVRYASMSHELKVSTLADYDEAYAILKSHNFVPINHKILHSPAQTKNEELVDKITREPDANYDYLLNLRERDLIKTNISKKEDNIISLQEELNNIIGLLSERPIIGASLWKKEITELLKDISL